MLFHSQLLNSRNLKQYQDLKKLKYVNLPEFEKKNPRTTSFLAGFNKTGKSVSVKSCGDIFARD